MNCLRDQLGPISGLFTPDEIECLARTAGEAVHGNALDDQTLSMRQIEVSSRAYDALAMEMEDDADLSDPPDTPPAVPPDTCPAPAADDRPTLCLAPDTPVWVLRFWDTGHEDLTVWVGDGAEDAAIGYLAAYVRANWSNLTDHRVVGEQPPAGDRDALRLFYGHPDKQPGQVGAEGYALAAEPARTTR